MPVAVVVRALPVSVMRIELCVKPQLNSLVMVGLMVQVAPAAKLLPGMGLAMLVIGTVRPSTNEPYGATVGC